MIHYGIEFQEFTDKSVTQRGVFNSTYSLQTLHEGRSEPLKLEK